MNPNFGNQGFRQQRPPGQMMMPNGPMRPQGQGQFMNPGQGHFMGPPQGQMMMGQPPMMGVRMRPAGAPPSYNQALNHSMQRPRGQMMHPNPNSGKTEEQIMKEKQFQQQQVKLKQFGKTGASTLDPNKLVDSIFGSSQPKPKQQQQQHQPHVQAIHGHQSQQHQQPATIDSDDGFGDFLSGPNNMASPIPQASVPPSQPFQSNIETNIQQQHIQAPIGHLDNTSGDKTQQSVSNPTQMSVKTDKKDLTKMMMESCDLNAPQKAKLFHKPSLKEINPVHAVAPVHHTSVAARRWDQSEELSQLFLQEAVKDVHTQPKKPVKHETTKHVHKPPPWLSDNSLIPAVYKQVYEACIVGNQISTERLYPILMLSGLPKEIMGQLWTLCNKTTPGQLIEKELYQLLAVIALTQHNFKVETLDILSRCPKAPVPFLAPAGTPVPPQSPIQMVPTSPNQLPGEPAPNASHFPIPSAAQIPVQTIGMAPSSAAMQVPVQTGSVPGLAHPGVVGPVPPSIASTMAAPGFGVAPPSQPGAPMLYSSHVTGNQATMMTSSMTSSPATLPVTQLPPAGLSAGIVGSSVNTPAAVVDDDDDDFADFQTASMSPVKTATVTSGLATAGELNLTSVNDSNKMSVSTDSGGAKSSANISQDLKHSTVENFFGSDDSSGSNSPDDDYFDGYKSADSKPSDSTSQFSTDQSEGEDFRNFENYLDEFQRKKDMQDKESPLHRPITKYLGKAKSPPSPTKQFPKAAAPIKKLPLPVHVKMPTTQAPPSSDEFSDFADFQSAPAPVKEITAHVNSAQDLLKASGSASDLIGDEDKYAALRSLDFSSLTEDPQPDLLGEPEAVIDKPQTDSEDNWADFQAAADDTVPDLNTSQNSIVSKELPIEDNAMTNATTTLPETDDSDWAAFSEGPSDVGAVQAENSWSGFESVSAPIPAVPKVSLFDAGNVISASVEITDNEPQADIDDDMGDWAEFKEGTSDDFNDFQSSNKDVLPKSDETGAGLVNIKRDKLDHNEILGLFKVKSDPKPTVISRDDDESFVSHTNTSLSASMNKLHGIGESQNNKTANSESVLVKQKQKHMSEEDDFMKPPPMDDFPDDDDHGDFSNFSRGYDDLDDIVKPNIPAKKNVFGMYGLNENFVVSGHKKETETVTESSDLKNVTIEVTKDSDVDNDTDSVSSKDNDVFREKFGLGNVAAEDSQSVASLELVSNKSLQNVRDAEGNDTQSVSSNEFGTFEIGVNKDILAESKSLDSLDLRQEDIVETSGSSMDNSDKDSKEETPPRETEEFTKPVFDLPSYSGLPVIGDRYSAIMHDAQGSDKHAAEWERCLDNCCRMIQDANNTFNSISSSSVCNEVIKSSQGSVYIQGVIEIYKIVCKISVTKNKSGIHSDKLTQLLKDIDLAWNNLTAFLVGGGVMPEEKSLVFVHGMIVSDDSSTHDKACGVCLLSVDMKTPSADTDNDNARLTYGGRQYHATCANFWINCVDSTLPALKLPELL